MSHDVCVEGLLGMGSPSRKVLGLKAQVLTKSDVKTPQIVGAEREVVIES